MIELGGRRLSVVHAPGHSLGHIAFHEPEREYLVTGDVLHRGTLYAFYESTDPVAFARSIDKLCELDRVATILPGHNEFGLAREDLSLAQASFHAIERKGRAAPWQRIARIRSNLHPPLERMKVTSAMSTVNR